MKHAEHTAREEVQVCIIWKERRQVRKKHTLEKPRGVKGISVLFSLLQGWADGKEQVLSLCGCYLCVEPAWLLLGLDFQGMLSLFSFLEHSRYLSSTWCDIPALSNEVAQTCGREQGEQAAFRRTQGWFRQHSIDILALLWGDKFCLLAFALFVGWISSCFWVFVPEPVLLRFDYGLTVWD